MRESAVQMPRLIQTEIGGKNTAKMARKMSEPHIAVDGNVPTSRMQLRQDRAITPSKE